MNIYEASKLVIDDGQYKLIRPKKAAEQNQLDVKDHEGSKKGGWMYLDGVTANLIVKVTEALKPEQREKFLSLRPLQAIDLAWKLAGR